MNRSFSIGFSDEPVEYPYDDTAIPAAPGILMLGECPEVFLANLGRWNKADYEAHWKTQLGAVLSGQRNVALVVSYNDPNFASHSEIWKMYREGDWVHFQNQLRWYDDLPPGFDIARMSSYIADRRVVNEDGDRISEWDVPVAEIESFLRCSA